MKLWDWQVRDQERLAELDDVALLNMEPGSGKTAAASAAIARTLPERALIIAPQATHQTAWSPTIKALTGRDARIVGNSNKTTKAALIDLEWGQEGIFLCTPQFFTRAASDQWAGDYLVVDEVHQLMKPGSKGQRQLSGYNDGDLALGPMFPYRLALSGTPLRNKFENAWSVARLLWPELYRRREVAHINHFLWKMDRMTNMEVITGRDQNGNLKRAKQWLTEREPGRWIGECPGVIQHFRRRECCEFHPDGFLSMDEPQITKKYIDLAPTQKRVIRDLETHYMAWLEDEPLVAELPITMQQRLRQVTLGVPDVHWSVDEEGEEKMSLSFDPECESPFFEEFLGIVDTLDEDEPVVVYLEHQSFAPVILSKLDKLGIPAIEYSGATRKGREDALATFGKPGGARVAVVVIAAGGTGLDGLQKVCKTEVWFETSTDNTNNIQAEARLDRLGATGQVQRFILVDTDGRAEGRMNKQIEKLLALRQSTTKGTK